ncbi:hypothetical protein NliqN6_2355 [Naganishia liquefaciens]|uniref:Galactose oxidase n=1 Tax=Naganishia liquefaciens TaxID=104408 RepID=A0A8H3TS85_9TREE|nr:hypothetical protein NliqN6_2355 [Naganishia liquefaciens]
MRSISWTHIPLSGIAPSVLDRSSHSLVVVGHKAYLFGGENVPRTPVDEELYIIDLNDGSTTTSRSTTRPSPRVGSFLTAHGDALYLWGGRESRDMTPCDASLWVYDIAADEWTRREAAGEVPEQRSYHCMAVAGERLFLHAGCPAKGRLDTVHSLPIPPSSSAHWTSHPSAPSPGRGGTVLCPLTIPSSGPSRRPVLVRFGGFAGYELGDTLDIYDPTTAQWTSTSVPGPEARSVHALVPYTSSTDPHLVALMLFGERDPAPVELGHNGAGKFHEDVWALRYLPPAEGAGEGEDVARGFSFVRIPAEGNTPEPRGWFGAGVWREGERERAVVLGGLNGKNERLGDLWIAEVK